MNKQFTALGLAAILSLTVASPALADDKHAGHGQGHDMKAAKSSAADDSMVEGEIRRVSKGSKKLTIKHGPIKSLDMPGMTMAFGVSDDSMLANVKKGDRVRFRVREVDGQFTVTEIETR